MTGRCRRRLAAALVLATLAGRGFAQFGGGMGGGGGGMGVGGGGMGVGGGGMGGRRGRQPDADTSHAADANPMNRSAQVRDRLNDLRLRLLITPEQSSAWDDFYAKAWDLLVRGSLAQSPEDGSQNAAQSIRQRAAEAGKKSAQWQQLADSVDRLYAMLSPDQQRIADQELPPLLR